MTDREYLELAAKAAGIDAEFDSDFNGMWLKGERTPDNNSYWNPLADDGDALRLAVKLRMSVKNTEIRASIIAERAWVVTTEPHGTDPYAATRRAIVRAAEEIGRSMT